MIRKFSGNQVVLAAALFLAAFTNLAFFRNVLASLADSPGELGHLLSISLILLCVLVMTLAVFSSRPLIKPTLVILFLLSSGTAYFMDTYNVIIDTGMITNVMATDSMEAMDLLTPRLFLYILLLGVLPSVFLLFIDIERETITSMLGARFKMAGAAALTVVMLVMASSAFYSSFVREHKYVRYYANPLASFYAIYKSVKQPLVTGHETFIEIGEDATIPPNDADRELIVMVVGETVRADRFSLNGYKRQTNPMLEHQGAVSFTHVSSCGTSTAVSVPCMFSSLTKHDFDLRESKTMENLLDVLDHAGVSILWRDNNSSSKGVANRVKTEDFRSTDTNPVCDTECRDEGMLAGLQDFIDRQASGDVLIVLHQMGSHGPAYFKRYPPSFRQFEPTCDTNQLDACTDEEIDNTYDNTILYTDHFLSEVIELLASNDHDFETGMVYVGDHGESLGESGIYLHGLPFVIAPEEQKRVPLVVWFGRNYHGAGVNSIGKLKDYSFSHDNIFHSMLGLFEINSNVYDPDLDIMFKANSLGS